jgi:hypothetical protein
MQEATSTYTLTIVTNRDEDSDEVVARTRPPGGGETGNQVLGLIWPRQVFSMSHVAIPFAKNDPWYGAGEDGQFSLGNLNPKGERRVLRVPMTQFTRLRYNPFFEYIEARLRDFVGQLRPRAASAE